MKKGLSLSRDALSDQRSKTQSFAYYTAFVVVPGIIGFVIFSVLDLTNSIIAFASRFESWEVDELFGTVLFILLGLVALTIVQRRRAIFGERKAESYIQGLADAIFIHKPSGRILEVNEFTCDLLGFTREELIGTSVFDHQEPMTEEQKSQVWERLTSGEQVSLRLRKIRRDGTSFPAEVHLNLIEVDGRREIISVLRDLTEREDMISNLRASEYRNAAFVRAMPDSVVHIDWDGKFLDVWQGESAEKYYPEGWIQDKGIRDIMELDLADEFMEKVAAAHRTDELQTIEYSVMTARGAVELETRIVAAEDGESYFFARDVSERNEMFRRVSESEARNRALLESVPDLVFRLSRDGYFLDVEVKEENKALMPRGEFLGKNVRDVLPPDMARTTIEKIQTSLATGKLQYWEHPLEINGEDLYFDIRVVPSGPDEVVYFARDITERREIEESLRRSEERNTAIMEAIPDIVYRFDRDGRFLDVTTNNEDRLRVPGDELVERRIEETAQTSAVAYKYTGAIRRALESGRMQTIEYDIEMPYGVMHRQARLVPSGTEEVVCFVSDVNERREFESRIRKLAYFDQLTGLPNRYGFMERLRELQENRGEGKTAVIIMNMKEVARTNDSLGRDLGDSILQAIGEQVARNFGEENSARLEGDEFAAVIYGLESEQELTDSISGGLKYYESRPFSFGEMDFYLRSRVGISFMVPNEHISNVMRRASVALLEAKKVEESNFKVFDQTMRQRAMWNLRLERDLRRAIENGDLGVHYQPEVYLKTGKVYSLEALARWEHPVHGWIRPGDFIPLAEETGLILPLGDYVLEEACRRMKEWRDELPHTAPCTVSVNVSAMQLRQRDFVGQVAELLQKYSLPERCLQLEITESAAITDVEESIRAFGELRALGVGIALDDFGTGHSSLAYLRSLPIDALKMDRSFNFQLDEDPKMSSIIAAVVELAHALDMRVISEGIETPEQLALLKRLGCDVGQGYYFSRPLPPEETRELLRSWRTLNLIRSS